MHLPNAQTVAVHHAAGTGIPAERDLKHLFPAGVYTISPSPYLPISLSPYLPISPSPYLPISLSPYLPISPSPHFLILFGQESRKAQMLLPSSVVTTVFS